MKRSKRKSPSRIKYEGSHPVVSIRLPKETYDDLMKFKGQSGYGLAEIIQATLNEQAIEIDIAYWTGYEDAEKSLRVTYPCSGCGKVIIVNTDEEKKAITEYMMESGWGHAN